MAFIEQPGKNIKWRPLQHVSDGRYTKNPVTRRAAQKGAYLCCGAPEACAESDLLSPAAELL